MTSIAEGFYRRSYGAYVHFLGISRASESETKSLFYVIGDLSYLNNIECSDELQRCDDLRSSLGALIKVIREKHNIL